MPKCSIITPVYNGERFIARSIESVLAQTYPRWELVVINDGSTDSTARIVAGFTDPRITTIHQDNRGLAAARNAGIQAARGDYLAFLDADDLWAPQFMERCLQVLGERQDIVGVYTGNYFIDEADTVLPRTSLRVVKPEALYGELLRGGFFPPHTVLIRSDVVRQLGMFDTGLAGRGTEDWDLWLRVARQYRMEAMPELLAYYRVYPGSMSTNAADMHDNRMAVLAKHFGPPEGDPRTWPAMKRLAYGFAYAGTAFSYLMARDVAQNWEYLDHAIRIYPELLDRTEIYFELACGDQDRSVRGLAEFLDLREAEHRLFKWIDHLQSWGQIKFQERLAFNKLIGNGYLVLAMLSNQLDLPSLTSNYLRKAVSANPKLLFNRFVIFLHVKFAAQRTPIWGWMQSWCLNRSKSS